MPAMTNLLVKDDSATPKEWTLIPITDTPNPIWRSNDSLLPIEAQPRVSVTMEKLKTGSYRVSLKTEVPVLETLGASGTSLGYVAAPKVAFVNTVITTLFADKRSTISDRANAMKIHCGLFAGASSVTATGVLNNASLGDVYKASVLPVIQAFISMVLPN